MILKRFAIERFGIWRNWEVNAIPCGLVVFFGPNETGKSTLLEFLRGMFFGFHPRARYAHPDSRELLGSLVLEHRGQEVTVSRRWAYGEEESVTLTIGDHGVSPEELTKTLCPVDEATFNAVFALGLEDLAYLRTLEEGKVADLLYELSLGIDRATLWRVLADFRRRLAEIESNKEVIELEEERARLLGHIAEIEHETTQFVRWRAAHRKLQSELRVLDERLCTLHREKEKCEAIFSLEPKWQEYKDIVRQLRGMGPLRQISKVALRKVYRLRKQIVSGRRTLIEWTDSLHNHEKAISELPLNTTMLEHAAEIEALRLHRDEILTCREQLAALMEQRDELLQTRSTIWHDLAARPQTPQMALSEAHSSADLEPGLDKRSTSRDWVALRRWIRRWQKITLEKRRILAKHQRHLAEQQTIEEQIRSVLEKYGAMDAQAALEERSQRLTALRRTRQLREQEISLRRRVEEITAEYRQQIARLLPSWQTWALVGSLSIPGFALVLLSLITLLGGPGSGSLGLATMVAGAAMIAAGIGGKMYGERRQRENLETLREDLEGFRRESKAISAEQQRLASEHRVAPSEIDQLLPQLEQEIRELEPVAMLQAKLAEARQQAERIAAAVQRIENQERDIAAQVWELSAPLQWPAARDADHAAQLWQIGRRLRNLDRRLTLLKGKIKEQEERVAAWQERVLRLARICGQSLEGKDALHVLDELVRDYETSLENRRRHLELERTKRLANRKIRQIKARIKRLITRYRAMLRQLGARTANELITIRENWQKAKNLQSQARSIRRELKAALVAAGVGDNAAFVATLQQAKANHRDCVAEIETTQDRLRVLQEKQGQIEAEVQRLIQSRQLDQTKLALAALEEQIQRRSQRRRELLLLAHFLERVRHRYELERQPDTLQRASLFLSQMTESRYQRIWTPITERTLLVEDTSGRSWRVEELSRGTREQLFLSLRLAIVQRSAEQGIHLPLILDDVLVNFDSQRAQAACRTLRDFAERTGQVLLLTCHDHIARLCNEMSVPVANLEMGASKGEAAHSFFSVLAPMTSRANDRGCSASPDNNEGTTGLDYAKAGVPPAEESNPVPTQTRRQRQKKTTSESKPRRTSSRSDAVQPASHEQSIPMESIAFGEANAWYAEADPYGDDLEEKPNQVASSESPSPSPALRVNNPTKQSRNRAA
ncbi:MAG: AAA family ATPase [Thermogutta sp.]